MEGETRLSAVEDEFAVLESFFPSGWREQAKTLGALRRCRGFGGAGALLRTLLIHLAEGCSLRETVVRARAGGIARVSDVALLKRLQCSGEWLRWMSAELVRAWVARLPEAVFARSRCA